MAFSIRSVALLAAVLCNSARALGQAPAAAKEPTSVMIRRLAGLTADSAIGQIEIIDVGHDPMDTMLSIVGHREPDGWQVSYACAMSPHCAPTADHIASSYRLPAAASAEVDQLIKKLRTDGEPDGQLPSSGFIGGHLLVSVDYGGFKHDYRRTGYWGKTLGRLEALMKPPQSKAD